MKVILFLALACLALHNGKGAPITAVYKFVRCNPEGDQANCVTHQSPEMAWSPDLPGKLPASAAQYLESEPVEGESPPKEEEEEDEEEIEVKETPMMSEEGESPMSYPPEDGSGFYEGSATEGTFMEDQAFLATESEIGSGKFWTGQNEEPVKGGDVMGTKWLVPRKSVYEEAKPAEQELKEDHLLQP